MKMKEITALEYFTQYFLSKPSERQIKAFKELVEAKEEGKDLFLIKRRRRL